MLYRCEFLFCQFTEAYGVYCKINLGTLADNYQKSHLSALNNGHVLVWLVSGGPGIFNHLNNIHSIDDLSKNDMFAIQKWSWCRCDEKLATIRIGARVLYWLVAQ